MLALIAYYVVLYGFFRLQVFLGGDIIVSAALCLLMALVWPAPTEEEDEL